ncbi:hypothetical protein [Moorena sp. SIO4G3]|uniref:hypothetical protein n=1 Tax=Moorena sp. SIO4G3 TaxID=2607821 RepID=UPI00142A8148|nr:hypothetical protein [Moorena sp. SIO4G3]NEO80788.1 hypothetical protein [Moorena sp. SIO4G3]
MRYSIFDYISLIMRDIIALKISLLLPFASCLLPLASCLLPLASCLLPFALIENLRQ